MSLDTKICELQRQLEACRQFDAVLDHLMSRGIPVTRERYLELNFPDGVPDPMPGELEAGLPWPLRRGYLDE